MMDKRRLYAGLALILLLAACSSLTVAAPPPTLAVPLAAAGEFDEGVEQVKATAGAYLDGWIAGDYPTMYALLTSLSQDAFSEARFTQQYRSINQEAALTEVRYELLSALVDRKKAQVRYRVTLVSRLVGEISRETVMNLRQEGPAWRIEWNDTLVLPELQGGNFLRMDRSGYTPARANIYDRNGKALVAQTEAASLELLPDRIPADRVEEVLEKVAAASGLALETVQARYRSAPAGADWYVPLIDISADRAATMGDLSALPGVTLRPIKARFYMDGGVAAHVVGYVTAIQPDEVAAYESLGYQADERVGRAGLEKWAEAYLTGRRGGALYVFNAQGRPAALLAKVEPQVAQAVYTTIDLDFQKQAQQALGDFRGAIVALERDTGRVLALASSPGFDPNAFETLTPNANQLRFEIISSPQNPLLNRATQGQYPLGSVFKIITEAAALSSGRYSAESTYQCGYTFEELPGAVLHDWTYDYFLANRNTAPSGLLTLPQGLMRSCNPWFWHIGLDLYNQGLTTTVSSMARGFGLGKPTLIIGLDGEAAGQVPDPERPIDAVNMAIGQGDVLVTPIQVATFIAAVGNGGTLFKPQLVERVAPPDAAPTLTFRPQPNGKLPLSADQLRVIQQAMVGVIRSEKPRGTAWHVFTGLEVPVAGKTGTAESEQARPHAWFAGYTFANRTDRPDIAVAVVVENAGEGSDYAAPIFRRIVELYFEGQPQKLYWWEAGFNQPITNTLTTPSGMPGVGAPGTGAPDGAADDGALAPTP